MKKLENLRLRGEALYKTVDRWLGGAPGVLVHTYGCFGRARAAESAASLAYYGLFALFPFLLVLIFIGTLFLGSKRAETELVGMVAQVLPGAQLVVQQNLVDVMQRRGSLTLVGLVGLIWAASGFFTALTLHLRRAWPTFGHYNFIDQRLSGIGAVFGLGFLLILWSAANVILNAIPQFFNNIPGAEAFWRISARILPIFVVFPVLLGLYRWTSPPGRRWRALLVGALFAAVALQALIIGFTWYLSSGLVNYEMVYGSLGGVIALLVVVYLLNFIMLLGAHLAASIDDHLRGGTQAAAEMTPGAEI